MKHGCFIEFLWRYAGNDSGRFGYKADATMVADAKSIAVSTKRNRPKDFPAAISLGGDVNYPTIGERNQPAQINNARSIAQTLRHSQYSLKKYRVS